MRCLTIARAWALLVLVVANVAGAASAPALRLTDMVDPMIGTGGTGHTFPGASLPFGMVAPSPDNADHGWAYTSGYQFNDAHIIGFSNTHISGAGIPELGDVLLQPAQGKGWSTATKDFSLMYDKRSERARPGYYAVTLASAGVRVELTATQRVALHRYTFAKAGEVQVLADFQHVLRFVTDGAVTDSSIAVDAAAGELSGRRHVHNWSEREQGILVRFDQPIKRVELLPQRPGEKAPRYLLRFDLKRGRVLQARIALSTIDAIGARRNLDEVAARSFDQLRNAADLAWEQHLKRIEISAPLRQRRIFYTALYHALLHPADIADVDGRVRGPTGTIMAAPDGHYYSSLSLWDTARADFPLQVLVTPERISGIVNTLLAHQRVVGYLPLWTAWGAETWCMIGNPALPVIAHALNTGVSNVDREKALDAMLATATSARPDAPAWAQRDWTLYEQYGYLPFDQAPNESVSKSLEYGWGDDAVARVAVLMGQPDVASRFAKRAQGYRLLFDPDTAMMRGRDGAGNWRTPFDPLAATSPLNNPGDYTEANAWQYTPTPALHDPQGLVQLLGGPHGAGEWLDRFYSTNSAQADKLLGQEGMIGQSSHGNEPDHHVPYLYAWTDRPWHGQQRVRQIVRSFYSDRPDGIAGNDDTGQLSAWYVFATLGFYPVVPASGDYVLGAPQVRRARLHLAGGRVLDIRADLLSAARPYASAARLNGLPISSTMMHHGQLAKGGVLQFIMQSPPH